MKDEQREKLGAPDIALGGLQIWIHGRQFPNMEDYWDGNWLRATAHCGGGGGDVWVSGSILHLREVATWLADCESLYRLLAGEAKLDCMEPYLNVLLTVDRLGRMIMEVSITPDHLTQTHTFAFDVDQSYLPNLIRQCESVLTAYPVRGSA